MKEVLDLVNQFGFPLVAAGGLVYTIIHLRKQHLEERKGWDEERKAWDEERKELYGMALERLTKAQEIGMNMVNKTSDIAGILENERKEIRDAHEREMRVLHTTGNNPRERR